MFRGLAGRLLLIAVTVLMPLVGSLTLALPTAADVTCADLVVTDITVTPSSPIVGHDAQVDVTVMNKGTCPAAGFVTQWQASQSGPAALSESLSGLNNGASHTFTWTFAFPKDGNFLTVATVDSGNAISETNEVNNTKILSVTVQPQTIDLKPTSIIFTPDPAVATDAMKATVHVVNDGNTDATDFQVEWDPTPNGPPQTQLVNSLAAGGGAVDVDFIYTYPNPGTFDTTATVDSLKDIKETNEKNNSITESLTVDPALPDLVVDNAVVSPANPVAGQPMTLTVTVKNVGHRPTSSDFEVDWTPVTGQKLQQQVVGPLNDGDSTNVVFNYTYDKGGSFIGNISVDSTNKVREVNEKNNDDALQVTVDSATVDLTITDFEASPNPPVQGQDTTFTVKIKNLGNTASGPFVLAVNPDSSNISSRGDQTVTTPVAGLNPGEEQTLTLHFQYPDAGNFRAIAQVDILKSVAESNEANNTALLNLVVKPGDIDLIVTDFTVDTDLCAQATPNACSPMKYWAGTAMTANITVTNVGSFPAGAFNIQWLRRETDTTGPTEAVAGLNPGDSITVHIHSTYSKDGIFNTFAVADPYDQVKEGCTNCEDNNVQPFAANAPTYTGNPINIQVRETTVQLTNPHFVVHNDLDDSPKGSGEWNMYYIVLDPNATNCTITWKISVIHVDIKLKKGFQCPGFNPNPDAPGDDDVGPGPTINVTLNDTTPLLIAIIGYEDDTFGADKTGSASKFWLPGDYQVAGSVVLNGQKGDSRCSNGDCFDATINVNVTSAPPPPAASSSSFSRIAATAAAHDAMTQINNVLSTIDSMSGPNPNPNRE